MVSARRSPESVTRGDEDAVRLRTAEFCILILRAFKQASDVVRTGHSAARPARVEPSRRPDRSAPFGLHPVVAVSSALTVRSPARHEWSASPASIRALECSDQPSVKCNAAVGRGDRPGFARERSSIIVAIGLFGPRLLAI